MISAQICRNRELYGIVFSTRMVRFSITARNVPVRLQTGLRIIDNMSIKPRVSPKPASAPPDVGDAARS